MDKISVVIPAYNAEDTIERAVESVRTQDYPSVEIIVVNDGSTDKTKEILEKLSGGTPSLRVIEKENGGVSAARNDGICAAAGKYLVTLDDDDYLDSGMLSRMAEGMRENDCDLMICGMRLVYPDHAECFLPEEEAVYEAGRFIDQQAAKLYDTHLLTTHSNKMYDLDLIRREEIFYDPALQINEDIDFVLRYLIACRKAGTVREPYLNYVQHPAGESLITTFRENGISSAAAVSERWRELAEKTGAGKETVQEMNRRFLIHILSCVGLMYYRSRLSGEEKKGHLKTLSENESFQRLLSETAPGDLKTAAASFLLKHRTVSLYHLLCCMFYHNRENS